MIITLTVNPSIDKILVVENFTIGNKRQFVQQTRKIAGGKGINVARVIKTLGEEVITCGFMGGASGEWIETRLKKEKIPFNFIKIKNETRTNLTILDSFKKTETHLREQGPEVSLKEIKRLKDNFSALVHKEDIVILSGSGPPGVAKTIYKELIKIVKNKGGKVILDAEGELLKEGIKEKPFMIKPNEDELRAIFKKDRKSLNALIERGKYLLKQGIKIVVVSRGKEGAIALGNKVIWQIKPLKIKSVNSVGSGDALIAGLAVGLKQKKSIKEAFYLGVACGMANALTEDPGYCLRKDIEQFYQKIKVNDLTNG